MRLPKHWAPLAFIAVATVIWVVIFALDLLPVLRGGYDWEWTFRPMLTRYRIAPLIAGVLCYVPVALWLQRQRRAIPLLVWSLLAGIGLTLAAVHVRGDLLYRLYSLTVSGRATGWHMASVRTQDLALVVGDWPRFMVEAKSFSPHIDHPPGMLLIYYAASHVLDQIPSLAEWLARPVRWLLCQYLTGYTNGQLAAAWLGILTPVWTSLAVVPLHFLGRRTFGDEATRWSVLWWPLIPGCLLFTPSPYTSFALPSLIVIAIFWEGLRHDRTLIICAAGVALSFISFISFAFIPLLLFAGLLTLGIHLLKSRLPTAKRLPWSWSIGIGLWFGLGFSIDWLIYFAATGTSLWDIWQVSHLTQLRVAAVRPYLPFLAWDTNDLLMFAGWPLALMAIAGALRTLRGLAGAGKANAGDVMIAAAGLTILLIILSGTPRGETGRLLLFLVPWLLYSAGTAVGNNRAMGAVLTALQAMVAVVMVVCLIVVGDEFRGRAAPNAPDVRFPALRASSQRVDAVLDGAVRLLAVEGRIDSRIDDSGQQQSSLYIWMTWQDLRPVNLPYSYSLRLADSPSGSPRSVLTIAPFSDSYPIACWKPEDGQLTDRVRIDLPPGDTQEWWADLAVVDTRTGKAAPWIRNDGQQSDSLRLGPFLP